MKQLTLDELRQAVLQLDETVLPATLVKQLRNYLPTADDRALLQPYKDDVSRETLARADRFMLEMDAIFHYDARLWVMELRAGYDERVQEMVSASRAIVDASKALRDADGFHQVLHCLLALGNVMNQNTFRGGAHGFRIQSLNRVVETKASKSGPNLLEYAVRQLLTTTPVERLAVGVELRTVGPAAKVSLPQLLKDMSELEEDVQSLAKEMDALTVNDATDPFIPCVRPFHAKASADLARLRAGYEDAVSAFKDVVKLYGEEDAEWTTKDFFGIFETFSVTIERTKMAVLEKMERDERRAAIELKRQAGGGMAISAGSDVKATESASAATDNMEQEAVGSGANGGSSANIMNDSRKGQMDALLESIRRGQHPDTRRDVASALNKSADSLFSATQVPRTTRMIKRNTIAADLRRVSIGNVTALTEDLLSQLMGSVTMFEEEGASDEK